MRIAVLFFGARSRDKTADVARGIAGALEKMGHHVDLIDGERDVDAKLSAYGFIVVGTAVNSLFRGRITSRVGEYLARSGMIAGKKSFAFVLKSPFGAQRALSRLMAAMEHEGLFIRSSQIIRSRVEAEHIARNLKTER